MNGTPRSLPRRTLATELAVMAAAALVAALIGPFGTFAMPFGTRLLSWSIFTFGGYAFFRPVIAGADALSVQGRTPRWAALAIAVALAALPTTLLVAWAITGMAWRGLTLGALVGLYPDVLILGGVVSAIQIALRRSPPSAPVPAAPPAEVPQPAPAAGPAEPALLAQLPPHLGRELLYLGNEDHYVRAYTREGEGLLLMRMRDAVGDVAQIDGVRVHRSWWVARVAVAGVLRRGRAVSLKLVDGREVPVARAMVPELRARGWLA